MPIDKNQRGFSVQFVRTLVDLGKDAGLPRQILLDNTCIAQCELEKKQGTIPWNKVIRLFQQVMIVSKNPYIGFQLARAIRPGSFGALGYALMNCSHLAQVLQLTKQHACLVSDVGIIGFEKQGKKATVYWDTATYDAELLRPAHEAFLAGWFLYSRWLIGEQAELIEVSFRHKKVDDQGRYQDLFNCPIQFEQPRNALVFSADFLAYPIRNADPELFEQMMEKIRAITRLRAEQTDLLEQITLLLKDNLAKGQANVKTIASRLNISERSLRRKLESKGYSFRSLVEKIRLELAQKLLAQTERNLFEIAAQLGYTDISTFSNAFKRWTGISPTTYRANNKG